jgi:hypothetical protein
MLTSYHTDNPVADEIRRTAALEAEVEAERHSRVIKCTATLWLTVDHATESEAEDEAYDFFCRLFTRADDYSIEECKEDRD